MVILLFVLIFLTTTSSTHTMFNISSVPIIISPAACTPNTFLTIIIHTNPLHKSLRDILRKTWASDEIGEKKVKRVFVIGQVEDEGLSNSLVEESDRFGDLLQGGFIDSYRNLTYKHLLWYRWVEESCRHADYVLKTDDDQFVDTFHLPRFLEHLPGTGDRWFLCQVLDRKPEREKTSKWFVTEEEFDGSTYPLYCGGWAYVTTVPTVRDVLARSHNLPYLWIDDLHVTGVIPSTMDGVNLYDWGYNFLNHHDHYRKELFEGTFFTPELMVCGDVTEQEIEVVFNKARKCKRSSCYDLIYKDENFDLAVFAPQHRTQNIERSEL